MPLETAALQSKQALAFEELLGNGAGSDVHIQVLRVAGPGNAVLIHVCRVTVIVRQPFADR